MCLDLTTIEGQHLSQPCPPTVIHLAALSREPGYPWDYFANNAAATRRLCHAADRVGVENIVFTTTPRALVSDFIRGGSRSYIWT